MTKIEKTLGPIIVIILFLAISSFIFIFHNKTADIFSFFILLIIVSSFITESLIIDLTALLITLVGLIGMSFTENIGRMILVGEIASVWLIIWILHLFNDRIKYQQAANNRELKDMVSDIENIKKEFSSNKIRFEKISERIRQYKNLTSATKEIVKVTNLQELKDKILIISKQILNCNNARLITFLPTDDRPPDIFDAWVVKKQSPLLIQNTLRDYRFDYSKIPNELKSTIAVPIMNNKSIIGVLRLDSDKENRFSQEDMSIISILVNVAEMTIENFTLLEKTKELSIIDGLTGVYVRKFFDERLQNEIIRASRFKKPVCLALSDIDHFKNFNDTYGHQQGDEALKRFSQVLKRICSETDIICRYGGEEFSFIFPETTKDECMGIAEDIRTEFEKELINNQHITVSIGISLFPEDAVEHNQLIRKADERLYKAKSAGRNRIIWKD